MNEHLARTPGCVIKMQDYLELDILQKKAPGQQTLSIILEIWKRGNPTVRQ